MGWPNDDPTLDPGEDERVILLADLAAILGCSRAAAGAWARRHGLRAQRRPWRVRSVDLARTLAAELSARSRLAEDAASPSPPSSPRARGGEPST